MAEGSAGRLLVVIAAVILIRLPFLNQAIQGDDVYYIAIARNVLVDPPHPMNMGYTYQGDRVSMAGHPHPPLNAYILAALLRIFGGVREAPFHLCYVLFSLIAAVAMYRLAKRFTERPLLATLLFVSVPVFVVNGNSLEADIPFLAFWMAGFAFYFDGRHRLAAASLGVAALGAYQAIFAAPILAHHAWHHRLRSKSAWLAVFAAPLALVAWQGFQRASSGEAPAGVLAGYLQTYGLLALTKKFHSALALTGHLGWIAIVPAVILARRKLPTGAVALIAAVALPGYLWWQRILIVVSLAAGLTILTLWVLTLRKDRATDSGVLAVWGLVFLAGAIAVFYAGSARYLLPLAPAVVFTVVRSVPRLWPAVVFNLALGLTMASANYHFWDDYRRFASEVRPLAGDRRIWTNADWGLRYYLETIGSEPLLRDQPVYPDSMVVTSQLAGTIPFSAGGPFREVLRSNLFSRPPIRLFGLGSRSGYSSSDLGILPFEPGRGPLDHVKAEIVGLATPRLSFLRLGDPNSADQLLSGFYAPEQNAWRWMGEQGIVLLKVPDGASRFEMTFYIAEPRRVTVAMNGMSIASRSYAAQGRYTLSAPAQPAGPTAQVSVSVDRTIQPPGDQRRLGMVVQELGFR